MVEREGEKAREKDSGEVSPLRQAHPRDRGVPDEDRGGDQKPAQGDLPRPVVLEPDPDARKRRGPEDGRYHERRRHPQIEAGALHPAILNSL